MVVPEGFKPRRVAFLGTPAIAVAPLRALVESGVEVSLVVSAADKRRGRGASRTASPVKAAALELGLRVTDDLDSLEASGADLGVVVAYGRILRPTTLTLMPFVNLHFSLLPRWRGAAPVERAILAGDVETGVALMAVEEGLDTGDVYALVRTPVGDKTLGELWAELSHMGSALLVDAVTGGFPTALAQNGAVTIASKLAADDRRLDEGTAVNLALATIRLGDAWTIVDGRRLKVRKAMVASGPAPLPGIVRGNVLGCLDGAIELLEVQPEGRGPMSGADWARGRR